MSQQIFNQWSPVVKAHDENNQEAYIPFAGIHAQTRDGKDEVIVGAGSMYFDPESELWLPVTKENPLPVEATLTGQNAPPASSRYELETVLDAETVPAGEGVDVVFNTKNAPQVYVLVNTDREPWTLSRSNSTPFGGATARVSEYLYPKLEGVSLTVPFTQFPAVAIPLLPVRQMSHNVGELLYPETVEDALRWVAVGSPRISFVNENDTNDATVTIRVLRIWR